MLCFSQVLIFDVLGCVGLLHVLDSHWLISQSSLGKSRDIMLTFIEIQY